MDYMMLVILIFVGLASFFIGFEVSDHINRGERREKLMKKVKRRRAAEMMIFTLIMATALSTQVQAKQEAYFDEPIQIRATCYVEHGYTASGKYTRQNTVAGCPEWMGCIAALYEVNDDDSMGDFIGYFEFIDTGAGIDTNGDGVGDTITDGFSIDIWQPDMAHANRWISKHGDYVYMKLIKGKG